MKVKDVLARKPNSIVSFIGADDRVTEAVRFMCDHRIGSLLVRDAKGETVGIVTERDILRSVHASLDRFRELRVSDIMTRDLICGLPDDDVEYVMRVMTQNRIRHLPVVHENRVVGLVSIGDVVNFRLDAARVENHRLQDFLHLRGEL